MGRGSLADLSRAPPPSPRRLRLAQAATLGSRTAAARVPRDGVGPARAQGVARRAASRSPAPTTRRSRASPSSSAASRPTACGASRNTAASSRRSSSAPRPARPPRAGAGASSSRRSSRGPTPSRPRSSPAASLGPVREVRARDRARDALAVLEAARTERGPGAAAVRLAALGVLAPRPPRDRDGRSSASTRRSASCAPTRTTRAVLGRTEALLAGFARRADLRRHRAALADSGIAGTKTRFPFFAGTARWLAARWGGHLRVDWRSVREEERPSSVSFLSSPCGPRRPRSTSSTSGRAAG